MPFGEVYFAAGALEVPKPGGRVVDMVGDMKQLERILKSRRHPGLQVQSRVFDGEDHLSVAPRIITGGLKWMLPPTR